MTQHFLVPPAEQAACARKSSIELLVSMTRTMYGAVDCVECLDRAIAEAEARLAVLRSRREALFDQGGDPW